jgi:hypothetical protein
MASKSSTLAFNNFCEFLILLHCSNMALGQAPKINCQSSLHYKNPETGQYCICGGTIYNDNTTTLWTYLEFAKTME